MAAWPLTIDTAEGRFTIETLKSATLPGGAPSVMSLSISFPQ